MVGSDMSTIYAVVCYSHCRATLFSTKSCECYGSYGRFSPTLG
jgi:hypothetical protein